MGLIKTKGMVIAENSMRDFDKMLTILTPSGKIGCAAKNAKKPKSTLMAASQFLCFGDYMIYKSAGSYHINSAETIEVFYNLRIDLEKLDYAVFISKIVGDVTDENQNTYRILQLLLNTMYMISETDKNLDLVLAIFELRLLCLLGFTPQIKTCSNCKKEEKITHFSVKENGFLCEACSKQDPASIRISEATAQAIRYIVLAPAKKIFSFDLVPESQKELELVCKLYLNEKLEKEYRLEKMGDKIIVPKEKITKSEEEKK